MRSYDAIVIGVGAMGSAACDQLAARGARVLGLEQFAIGHDRGSSHGETRIIRKAYFEHPDYVPLLHRAYQLWDELQIDSDALLFERVGLLMLGLPGGEILSEVRRAAKLHALKMEDVRAADVAERFPGFEPHEHSDALYEADAGLLHAEACVRAMVARAIRRGAEVRSNEEVVSWSASAAGVEVRTRNETLRAKRLVLTAGAWSGRLLSELRIPLEIRRRIQLWFPAAAGAYRAADRSPVFCVDAGDHFYYGAPVVAGDSMKVAEHTGRDVVADPNQLDRTVRLADTERVRGFVERTLPRLRPHVVRHAVCMYTMTPDGQFIIDRHPRHESVVFAAGFSGHGFKFAPLIGEVLADLTLNGTTAAPVGFLSFRDDRW